MSQPSLPAGWQAQWNAEHNRYLFVDTINQRSQWEEPTGPAAVDAQAGAGAQQQQQQQAPTASAPAASSTTNPRRRQYPTAQIAQAYAEGGPAAALGGTAGSAAGYGQPGAGAGYDQGYAGGQQQQMQGGQSGYGQQQQPAQLFTPGMVAGGAPAASTQGGYFAPTGGVQPGQTGGYADQKAFSVVGGAAAVDPSAGQQAGMGGMINQFSNMGMQNGGGAGGANGYPQPGVGGAQYQQPGPQGGASHGSHPLINLNLIGLQPSVPDLTRDPPAPLLPPGACISNNPGANAHHSYQRSTINAIPTTASLLGKTKIPLALILTPYRSVQEGDVSQRIQAMHNRGLWMLS